MVRRDGGVEGEREREREREREVVIVIVGERERKQYAKQGSILTVLWSQLNFAQPSFLPIHVYTTY